MRDASQFASLHNHSDKSLLDSTMKPDQVVQQAYDNGYKAVAISEHGNMHSFVDGYKKAKELGIKYIFACEVYETTDMKWKEPESDRYHLLLMAKNQEGLENLFKVVSEGATRGFYGKPRVDLETLAHHSEGLIATSACLASRLMRLLQQGFCPCCKKGNGEHSESCDTDDSFEPKWDEAKDELNKYKQVFGDDFYIELQSHDTHDQKVGNQRILQLAKETNTKTIITFDSHMKDGSEKTRDIHRKFVAISQNSREVGETYKDCYQQDMDTMYSIMSQQISEEDIDKAVDGTSDIADKCNVDIDLSGKPLMPHASIPDNFETEIDYLKHLINQGWKKRGVNKFSKEDKDKYKERIMQELEVLEYLDYIGYFLILAQMSDKFKENDIPLGYSRGSGAGSLIFWLIGVTEIDSIRWDLDFSRFANKGRKAMADYDMDMGKRKRPLALKLTEEMFGKENVAHLSTFNTLSAKVALKDLAKVFDEEGTYKIPYKTRDHLAKQILDGMSIEDSLEESRDLKKQQEKFPLLFEYAMEVEGLSKSVGCHASAIIITNDPIVKYSPVMLNKDGQDMLHVEMGNAEKDLGLIKFDYLGLISIDTIDDTLKLSGLSWDDIEIQKMDEEKLLEDRNVLDKIYGQGDTLGVFQMESYVAQDLFRRIKPDSVEDIFAVNAMNRPALLSVGMHNKYIEWKHDQSKIDVVHEDLKELFSKTNGVMLYQEDLLNVFRYAGFPEEQVDNGRRCLRGDTLVTMSDGNKKPIKDIKVGDRVMSFNSEGYSEEKRVSKIFDNGVKKVNKYTTELGMELVSTKDHHVLTFGGYRPLSEINIGDSMMTPTKINTKKQSVRSNKLLSSDALYLIGLLIGDGTLDSNSPSFTNSDLDIIEKFKVAVSKTIRKDVNSIDFNIKYQNGKTVDKIYNIKLNGRDNEKLVSFIERYNLRKKSKDKEIPEFLHSYPLKKLSRLISGLFDTDGGVYKDVYIDYSTISLNLATQLKSLLLQYGVYSYIIKKYVKGYDYYLYRVYISDKSSVSNFMFWISPYMSCKRKKEAVEFLFNSYGEGFHNYYLPKEATKELRLSQEKKGESHREMSIKIGGYTLEGGFKMPIEGDMIKDTKASKLVPILNAPNTQRILQSQYKPAYVKDIEVDFDECKVYDIEVEDNHNYIANDLIVHNSVGKKLPEEMKKLYKDFHDGLEEKDWTEEQIAEMWDLVEAQAGYGFNRSHSVAYGLLSFVMGYLKYYHPVEFMTALLISETGDYEQTSKYINACKEMDIPVLPPNINKAQRDYTVAEYKGKKSILFGFESVKGVGGKAVTIIEEERANGDFKNLKDFVERTGVDKTTTISLIKAGSFEGDKEKLLKEYSEILYIPTKYGDVKSLPSRKKLIDFGILPDDESRSKEGFKDKEWCLNQYNKYRYKVYVDKEKERKKKHMDSFEEKYFGDPSMYEFETLQIFLNGSPFDKYSSLLKPLEEHNDEDKKALLGGTIFDIDRKKQKNGKAFAYLEVLTIHGVYEGMVFNEAYEEFFDLIEKGTNVVMLVKKSGTQFIVSKMRTLESWIPIAEKKINEDKQN